jgi:hypothetical protein
MVHLTFVTRCAGTSASNDSKDMQCKRKRNIEARSCNRYSRGKALSITYSECVCSLRFPA